MATQAHQIKGIARSVFVRHGVDADRLSIQVSGDRVSIRGTIRFLPARARNGEIGPMDLVRLDQELRGKREIKYVRWQLENFRHDGASFVPLGDQGQRTRRRR